MTLWTSLGGEWVTAYQAEQRSRLRAVFLSQQQRVAYGQVWSHLRPPTNTREASGATRRVLDREFLMRHCFVEHPTDLSDADISGVHQSSVRRASYILYVHIIVCRITDGGCIYHVAVQSRGLH